VRSNYWQRSHPPTRYLLVPRYIAFMITLPLLTVFADFLGVLGGWLISVKALRIPEGPYWQFSASGVDNWQIFEGIVKAVFFGAIISWMGCYHGFRTEGGMRMDDCVRCHHGQGLENSCLDCHK